MCGIVGYVGCDNAVDYLVDGLSRLEYRGYDSSGVAVVGQDGLIETVKAVGKISALTRKLEGRSVSGTCGIGHTRWATHGAPSAENAHPHQSCDGRISLVHNGIVENFQVLRKELEAAGHVFVSQTDTEVIVHLIEEAYTGDPIDAIRSAVLQMEGAWALAVVFADKPDCVYVTRKDSPLAVCTTGEASMLASDAIPLVPFANEIHYLEDGEIDVLHATGVIECYDVEGRVVEYAVEKTMLKPGDVDLGPFSEYMMKEICEQPSVIQGIVGAHVQEGAVVFSEEEFPAAHAKLIDHITIVACGTSYHAGLFARELFEDWLGIRCDVEVASEYRYRKPVANEQTLVLAISQSGETADTLAALRLARSKGAKVIALTNVPGSRITREADSTALINAGVEISVAATKSFTAQLALLSLLGLYLAQERETMSVELVSKRVRELQALPLLIEQVLEDTSQIEWVAKRLVDKHSVIYLGRGMSNVTCREGALKLKEISYIHAEAYAAGEIKHGPIALIDPDTPVVAVAVNADTLQKTMSNVREVQARNAKVVVVATEGNNEISAVADSVMWIPRTSEEFSCILASVPLQLLAFFIAKGKGCNVDQPRNLAKSVTVE
ncbi:MAG: glutamine--fructose-6-phosphate transaminase (isomerizing) [Gordonibacter sp.]|nr:glutamine--fructose-6-phosphate transaminase (isomerizing) [Gordonibacter sp.]